MSGKSPVFELLAEADRCGELISGLLSIERGVHRKECGEMLSELHNSGRISLFSEHNLATIQRLGNNDFWKIVHSFNKAIPGLKCSFRDVLGLVRILVLKAGSDGAAGMPNVSLVEWCKANPNEARLIVEGAISLDELCLSHCAFAMQALGDEGLAFELLKHTDKSVVTAGLCSLGRIEVGNEDAAKRIIDVCFEAVRVEGFEELRNAAIQTAFGSWDRYEFLEGYRQKEFISSIVDRNKGGEVVSLSAALFYHEKGLLDESVNIILEALSGEVQSPEAVIYWVDMALHSGERCWDRVRVIDAVAAQILNNEKNVDPGQLHHFDEWIWGSKENIAHIFSIWLGSGESKLCEFLAGMVGRDGKKDRIVDISMASLPKTEVDQIFLARKCVGFLWFYEVTAASILLSIVKNGMKSAREEAEKLLYDPLLISYSGGLREFLEGFQGGAISTCF